MNKTETEIKKSETLEQVDINYRTKKNTIVINRVNTPRHEFSKFLAGWLIRRDVPVSMIEDIFEDSRTKRILKKVENILLDLEHDYSVPNDNNWEREEFITECKLNNGREIDLLTLISDKKIEFETDPKRAKKGEVTSINI